MTPLILLAVSGLFTGLWLLWLTRKVTPRRPRLPKEFWERYGANVVQFQPRKKRRGA